jgi:transcriptional regulator|tara:strand:+ start:1141 stop:1770 length:630 start_codon:yes stop_codon:yes gene_type:complete
MYTPEHFEEKNINEIKKIIDTFPLATVFINGPNGFSANHIPLVCHFNTDGTQTILGHIARENEVYKENRNGDKVLVVYKAEDSYISPNWYSTNKITHEVVPTWNYQAVHFHGEISFFEDKKSLLGILGKLTKIHEKKIGEKEPWKIKDAPREYIEKKISAIVGIKIDVSRYEAKSKLNQNKTELDLKSVKKKMIQLKKEVLYLAMDKLK